MDTSLVATVLSTAIGLITAIAGAIKIVRDANEASRASDISEVDQITAKYKGIADEFLKLREEDRYTFDRKIGILKEELEGKIEKLQKENETFKEQRQSDLDIISRLVRRIIYLTEIVRNVSPNHSIDPLETDLEKLIKEYSS